MASFSAEISLHNFGRYIEFFVIINEEDHFMEDCNWNDLQHYVFKL